MRSDGSHDLYAHDNNLYTFFNNESVRPPEKVPPNSVIIMDNVIGENQNVIRDYFTRRRHNKIDIFYFAPTYSKVQLIRDNDNLIVLLKKVKINLKLVYNEHSSNDIYIYITINVFRI